MGVEPCVSSCTMGRSSRLTLVFIALTATILSARVQADTATCTINAKLVFALSILKKDHPERTKADLFEFVRMTHEAMNPAPMTALQELSAMGVINFVMENT